MPEHELFLPEGLRPLVPYSLDALRDAAERQTILEGTVLRCDAQRTLHVSVGGFSGRIPRREAIAPWISGADRDIALLSRVGRPVCFQVLSVGADEKGAPRLLLSRRAAQERAGAYLKERLRPGVVLTGRVTHLEPFGAFVDIGCGVIALLPIERISVSRVPHPDCRFQVGQKLLAAVAAVDPAIPRFTLTHKELLGTWLENASRFAPGDTVTGIVRSVKEYGCFVELSPNLSGLADRKEGVAEGDRVSVYLKSIRPENMKIKLHIIQRLPPEDGPAPLRYTVTDGHLTRWTYSPPTYEKPPVETVFAESAAIAPRP